MALSSLTVRVQRRRDAGPVLGLHEVRLLVDGVDLVDRVAEVERPYAEAEGNAGLAGGYVGIDPRDAFLPDSHFLGSVSSSGAAS